MTVGTRAIVRVQSVLRLSRFSEPQPDFVLLRPWRDYYASHHPSAEDSFLVIEVSESSLRYDLEIRAALYERHRVPEVWAIEPELLPGVAVDLAGILPPRELTDS